MKKIEEEHKANFKFIEKHNLNVGDMILCGSMLRRVKNISKCYGWICSDSGQHSLAQIDRVFNKVRWGDVYIERIQKVMKNES